MTRQDSTPGSTCVWKINDFDLSAETEGMEIGEKIVLEYAELTDEEFDALGDFNGW